MKRRFGTALALTLMLMLLCATAGAYVDTSIKIYDDADLFTKRELAELSVYANEISAAHGMDIVVLTTADTQGKTSMAYADDFYDDNNFGSDSRYSGLLLLINMQERYIWISTTGDAIDVFTDARIDAICDAVYAHLSNGDYASGAEAFIQEADAYLRMDDQLRTDALPDNYNGYDGYYDGYYDSSYDNSYYVGDGSSAGLLAFGALVGAGIGLIVVLVMRGKHKMVRKAAQAGSYLQENSFSLSLVLDKFVRSHTSKTARSQDSGGRSGGGGGSSRHISSSGRSHGGGGRKF